MPDLLHVPFLRWHKSKQPVVYYKTESIIPQIEISGVSSSVAFGQEQKGLLHIVPLEVISKHYLLMGLPFPCIYEGFFYPLKMTKNT